MNFFFYLPNLAVAEMDLRAQRPNSSILLRTATFAALALSVLVVIGGLYTQL
jgi:hypothetical protein